VADIDGDPAEYDVVDTEEEIRALATCPGIIVMADR
jgi:hypothetical protein